MWVWILVLYLARQIYSLGRVRTGYWEYLVIIERVWQEWGKIHNEAGRNLYFFQLSLPLYVCLSLHDDFNSQQIMLIA